MPSGCWPLWNNDDQWHRAAKGAFVPISDGRTTLVTTPFILAECGNAASRTPFRAEADRLWLEFEAAETLIWPTEADWHQAWNAYQRGEADAAGIVDHISFTVMRPLGVAMAFTNDRHFRAAGFETMF
jgi:predicted nucleic acid-binding protein